MSDASRFPAPAFKETVLAPLFEGVKRHHFSYLMRINRAHGVMLGERGILSADELKAILNGLAAIVDGLDLARTTYTGEHEDLYFLVESELIKRIGADIAGKLHTGRSRNDIDHTVFKMALKDRLTGYLDALNETIAGLIEVATRHAATIVVAYTHGQPAQPTTFGHYLGALIEVLQRDVGRLLYAGQALDLSSMGAAAITTSGYGLDRARVAELLGFTGVQENSYGCIAACDYITGVYAALKVHMLNLGRFVQDLNMWTGFEVGHLHVPDGFVQISSIMPQKRNPVPVEHLRLLASLAGGRCDTVLNTMHNTPFTDMNDSESEVQIAGYEAFDTAARAMTLLRAFMAAVTIDEARVRRHIDESCVTITELADSLVRGEKITQRQAHGIAARLARRVIDDKTSLADLPYPIFAEAFQAVTGRAPKLAAADIRRFATPEHFIAVRTMPGGPAPVALAASLAHYRDRLAQDGAALQALRDRAAAGAAKLSAAVQRAIGR
ncbi:MAG: argininosuccinate lyase [Alphaproteobacteria bacterium]|nr:argininosuccinate lyase [Alphaproteobacteria bacterium]